MSIEASTVSIEMKSSTRFVGRLAPSPTGGLHLGNARTFLVAWLLVRKANGTIIFRMEDLDSTRARTGAAAAAIEDLRWLGLDWDEGPDVGGPNSPYVQSQRHDVYRDALDRLIADDLVYPCTCTRAEVARLASAPHAEDEPPAYPGICSYRHAVDGQILSNEGRAFAWRFRAAGKSVAWQDEVLGPQLHELDRIGGDFIVARSRDAFSYQLAVVVDDAAMGITQVVRGKDLVDSTPRQILIQQALGLPRPTYFHLGLVMGPEGKRLAKRDASVKLGYLKAAGIKPEAVVGSLANSLGFDTTTAMPSQLLTMAWPGSTRGLGDDLTIDGAELSVRPNQ